ncbi:MAG: hypothetical protein GY816_16405 [Cytophagales bacterium]|nr:hypothetical protein [Cytophagales bacterium]
MADWITDIDGLISIASSEPQLAYSAFVYGTSKRWNFVARTTPGISELLYKLEYHIKDRFIPALIGKQFVPDNLSNIFSIPACLGGLGINNITQSAELEYNNSQTITAALADAIFNQNCSFHYNDEVQKSLQLKIKQEREKFNLQQDMINSLWCICATVKYGLFGFLATRWPILVRNTSDLWILRVL